MAGRLAAVPEESMDCSTAAYPPRSPYRDLIRRVAVLSRAQIRSTLFSHSQSGHTSGSSYSGDSASNSYPSNNSGCSSGSAAAVELGAHELSSIARRMVSDGYIQRMAQAFSDASPEPAALGYSGDQDDLFSVLENWFLAATTGTPTVVYSDDQHRVLENWFLELDVDWVLQIRQEEAWHSRWQLRLQDNSGSSLQDLVERWIRGLTVIVHCMVELKSTHNEMTAVKRFGKASIFKMLIFVDAMAPAWKAENLRTVLDMYMCLGSRAMYNLTDSDFVNFHLMYLIVAIPKLEKAICSTMEKVRTLVEDDDSWAIEVPRGGGEVHKNTRWIVDCILALDEAKARFTRTIGGLWITSQRNLLLSVEKHGHGPSAFSLEKALASSSISNTSLLNDTTSLSAVRYATITYLKGLLVRKSKLCSDPSLGNLFLLNNYYFAEQMMEPCDTTQDWKLTYECESYMDSYLDVSWGHALSCIQRSHFPGLLHRWINTSSLAKFESAFNKTYQAQKFWKVPDPRLRDVLRRAITERVASSYRNYLNEHPELADHVSRRNITPDVLEEMLGQLFEG